MDWWEFLIVMCFILPITVLWLGCIIDAIARPDISGWAKALWVLFIIFLPLIGSLVYIITRPAILPQTRGAADEAWSAVPGVTSTATSMESRSPSP